MLAFDDALCLCHATNAELRDIAGDPAFKQALAAVAALKEKTTP
jgi:hypothetical protein